jgi:nucleotide-binding universal stress UspA family protein
MRDLLVHLDSTPAAAGRLAIAAALAAARQGMLVGLFAQADTEVRGVTSDWPTARYRAAVAAAQEAFDGACRAAGIPGEFVDAGTGQAEAIIEAVVTATRHAALAVIGQSAEGSGVPAELPEQAILQGGRPVLLVPSIGRYGTPGKRALIAWNGSREAARAVGDAIDLLRGAEEVTVMALETSRRRKAGRDGDEVVAHLARNGIKAKLDDLPVDDIGVMDMLLNAAADLGADLLVMGAHGHYGFPHFSRGAGTRHILRSMTLPVLMSH